MASDTTALLMLGGEGPGAVERWVAAGRMAAAADAARAVAALPGMARVVLATSEREMAGVYPDLPVEWDFDLPGEALHFGRRLAGLMDRYPAACYLYLGAGSVPLLPAETLAQAVEQVAAAQTPSAVANNVHSTDWIVLNCPAAVQARPERLPADNALGWVLLTEAGVAVRGLPPDAGARLDIDTPADLLLLRLHPRVGPELSQFLRGQPYGSGRWLPAGRRLFAAGGHVAIIGRVASGVWAHVEAHTQSWIRVFSEERGMSASGRLAAGQVRSLVGAHLARVGPRAFFAELAGMAEAVFFDTRVVLAHERRWPSAADRYASDLGLADQIADPYLRALTAAAAESGLAVVLGGHGVVAGDLYGLVEVAQLDGLAEEA